LHGEASGIIPSRTSKKKRLKYKGTTVGKNDQLRKKYLERFYRGRGCGITEVGAERKTYPDMEGLALLKTTSRGKKNTHGVAVVE